MQTPSVFHFNNRNYLCIIDYHSKFPVIKRMEGLSTESLIATTKIIFAEYEIPPRLMSDTGTNFVSDKFRRFCNWLNIEQAVLSTYHYQSNGQVKACIKFIKTHTKKCANSGADIHMALLQIYTTPLGQGLPSLATLLFNGLVCSVMLVIDRKPIDRYNDDEHHGKRVHRQHKNDTNNDALPVVGFIPLGSTVAVQWEDGGPWTHGMVIGMGDQNHHNQSYTIQITTTGRRITHKRQYVRLTPITIENYICYQATKHANRQTDPLDATLEYIKNSAMSYSNRTVQSNINNTQSSHDKQQPKTICRKVDRNTYKEQ